MPGDINKQDNINNADAQWLLEHLAQNPNYSGTEQGYTLEEFKEQCTVVNPSGNVFSCADASYIYSHVKEQVNSTNNYPITQPEPEPEPEPGTGGYQFADKAALQTAVNLWISNKSTALSTYGEINTWDTSLVTDMKDLFRDKTTFNDNISNWDVSNVTTMDMMFSDARAFNQPIGSWDVSNVNTMYRMFMDAYSFNSSIGNWDTSNVTSMKSMFRTARGFNQDISTKPNVTMNGKTYTAWNVSKVTNMHGMLHNNSVDPYAFNQPIGNWDVSKVTNMGYMFTRAQVFNQPLGDWVVSNVTNMHALFTEAAAFNQEIRNWDVSNVNYFGSMFFWATKMNASPWNAPDTPDASWFNQ